MRDVKTLPTSFLYEHESKFNLQAYLDVEDDVDFPFKYVIHDNDIEAYMMRWIVDRWDTEATRVSGIYRQQAATKATSRKGKRQRNESHERGSMLNEQRGLTLRDGQEEEISDDNISLADEEDLVIEPEEAVQVQNSLRVFTAAEMMP